MDKDIYRAPKSELVEVDGRLGGVQFSRVGAFHKNDAIIYYNGTSEEPDDARSNLFNLWDED